ncbi:MAG: Gfo/Idh/MocA family oxidoreductase [Lentisphaerae bacterium]|jgi:predicted dehydrogenase|nr:Gfo/Idh/MocA family oxidoreductase [Lentisphaerota bacterium]MBT4819682.1 Gfo/Idh/MocA family oxidoreductase [Lentisphaerota bacterium]MBT5606426.1 Gfo/Idh/MocA family oxidoreductase [Lentisphaerota bacterium]MBT7057226.1 Gfo/Idh/MocA family oxidoreductase [Lentisphaerota bacterium]MBT7843529.1 Gfo/Idh/MocA family oxidoreductase [Lentisphaerota bacterium]
MATERTIGVGITGTGGRGTTCLGQRIVETAAETGFRVVAVNDVNPERMKEAKGYLTAKFAAAGVQTDIQCHPTDTELVADPNVDIVIVTSPQYAHCKNATIGLRSGKKTYVDKPIAHNLEDAARIVEAEASADSPILMGFTRRYEKAWRTAFSMIQDGVIGETRMLLLRAVIPSHVYFHKFYRRREWSGGVLNEKSAHHFDVFNWFAQSRVTQLSAIGGQAVYRPRDDSPTRCSECDCECPYRIGARGQAEAQDQIALFGRSWMDETEEIYRHDNCVYLPGADNCDHATVQMLYENGVTASLFLCVFGPRAHDAETFEIVGTSGRIILDRHGAKLDVASDYGKKQEIIDCRDAETKSSHFGADLELVREMRRWYDGAIPIVSAKDGYQATRMSLAAVQSLTDSGAVVPLPAH